MQLTRKTRNATRSNGLEEVTASAAVDLTQGTDVRYIQTVLSTSKFQGVLPWKWHDKIGEVHYGIGRGARIAGYAKIIAVELGKDGTPTREARGLPADIAASIESPYGGVRGLIERFYTLSKVPGDSYLIKMPNDDGYDVLDADEIDVEGLEWGERDVRGEQVLRPGRNFKRITHPMVGHGSNGTSNRLSIEIPVENFLGRIWRPAARYVDVADSPLRALEDQCDLLHMLTLNLKAKILSRLALNGIVFIPSEINQVADSMPSGANVNVIRDGKVIDRIIRAASARILNLDDPEGALPIFVSGPAIYSDAIKFIVMEREVFVQDMALREELIGRILVGLDANPQQVKGDGSSNHWNAWGEADDEQRVNIRPDIETFVWAATRMILHRQMVEAGLPAGRIRKTVLWYDLSAANAKTNLAEDARLAADRLWIGPASGRKRTGLDEAEAPTNEEYIRAFGVLKGDPYLATFGMPEQAKIDWDKVAATKPGPASQSAGGPARKGPGVGDPGSPNDNETDTPRKLRPA